MLSMSRKTTTLSVVIPVFNEAENLVILHSRLQQTMSEMNILYEVIYVNDGSTDRSRVILEELARADVFTRIINFDRNYGQTAAFVAGFGAARGKYVVTLDADLQNSPSDIPKLYRFLPKYDVVCGVRKQRQDSVLRIISSRIANTVRNYLTHENITDTGCSLKIFKKEYLEKIPLFEGMHRFFPTLVKLKGGLVKEVEVSHYSRRFGTSKYNVMNRVFISFMDCLAIKWMQRRNINYRVIGNE